MIPNQKNPLKVKQSKPICFHPTGIMPVLALFLIASMLLAACKPEQPSVTPTRTPAEPSNTPTPEFTALDEGAPIPPVVVNVSPAGGQEMPLDGAIEVEFDQSMDSAATARAWQVTGPEGETVNGELTWQNGRRLRFAPAGSWQTGAVYHASLGITALSAAGEPLREPLNLEFNTVGELQVSQVFPAQSATEVAGDAVITVIFNRPVIPLTILEERGDLPQPLALSPDAPGKGEWVNTSVYNFSPARQLRGGVTYTATVLAGLVDATGSSSLAEDYTWEFTTAAPSLALYELGSGEVNPPYAKGNVLLDEFFRIYFRQPMDPTSTEAALSLTSQNGEPALLQTTWSEDVQTLVITPTQRLALGTRYDLVLSPEALAENGGALSAGLNFRFTTLPAPAVLSTNPRNGSRQPSYSSYFSIQFASPMNIESVKSHITISPAPEEDPQWWFNEWDRTFGAVFLRPSTQYTIRLLPGMQDIYGNEITKGSDIRFTTAAMQPEAALQMPYQPVVLRAAGPQEFYLTYRNVSSVSLQLYRLTPELFTQLENGSRSRSDYQPPASDLVWETEQVSTARLNERQLDLLDLTSGGEQPLEPGFYFLTLDSPNVYHYGLYVDTRLLLVSTANLAFKSAADEELVWLTDLESGEPLSGVPIVAYDNNFDPIGRGETGADGSLKLSNLPAPNDPYTVRFVMTDPDRAGETLAFASSYWSSGVSLWDYGIWGSYYAPPNQPTAYVYTERPIYRPGQPVYFKGIVRMDDDLDYSLPDAAQVEVTIESFEDEVYRESFSLSSFGSFDGRWVIDSDAALGAYTIRVRFPGQTADTADIGSVSFSVAEYRRPEIQVNVSAGAPAVLAGDEMLFTTQADYYSGGGVAGAQVDWTLTSAPYTFSPGGELSSYRFQDYDEEFYFMPNPEGSFSETVANGSGVTDANGTFVKPLPASLEAESGSRQFTYEATVTDLSANAVSGRTTVIAHRSGVYPGVRPGTYVGTAGKASSFEMVAVDWDANLLANQALQVEVVERRWYSVQEQDAQGRLRWTSSVEEIPVAGPEEVVTDEAGKAEYSFIPPKGGVYKALVTTTDARGNTARSAAYLWVAGDEFIPWRQTNDRKFDLIADRQLYAPGDTAEILIASPFQGPAYALVTVERGRVRFAEVILLENNSTLYRLPVTADMAPNVYVSVLVVKGVDENNPRPNYKMGIVELKVEPSTQELKVEVIPDRTQVEPRDKVTFTVRTTTLDGAPVSAEVSLGLSDLATLSLVPANSRPILDHFYSQRTLGVWTSIPLNNSLDDWNASITEDLANAQEGGSSGGKGGGGLLGVIDVREEFPDTAYWEAYIVTDEKGEAQVAVTLPDNLTTWRMDARAVTEDTRVGQITVDVVCSLPLLVRPQTPRFFVVGDQVMLGAAVHNNTGENMQVEVSLQAQGLALLSEAGQAIEIGAGQQAYVSWEALVEPTAADGSPISRVDLIFRAAGGGYSDTTRPTFGPLEGQGLPVYRYEAHETAGTSGQVPAGGTQVEAINLPSSWQAGDPHSGSLTVKVSPSLAAGMTDGLEYLKSYPYECIEQTISRFLPNVVTTQALLAAGISDPELAAGLEEQVNAALQKLYNWQNTDGGWGWWNNQKSDPLTSAYTVLGLVEARDAGYTVNQATIARGLAYLKRNIRQLARLEQPYLINRQAFLLYVLGRAGEPDVSATVQLYDQRLELALYARAYLAHTLFWIDPDDARLPTLLSDFNSAAITSATGTHWEEESKDVYNWNSDTRTTAIVLAALSELDAQNPLNANAVRWLMAHRTNAGYWNSTQETAWTILGLTRWMVGSGELAADYRFAVALNSNQLGDGTANADNLRQTTEFKVDVAELLLGEANRLAIARDEGPGNLYYTAHLDVSLPVEEVQALDQGIVVSRSYASMDDPQIPVQEAEVGDLLLARLTIVAPNTLHYLLVEDPWPAGLEGVDQSLNTSTQSVSPYQFNSDDFNRNGWGWWYFDHVEMRDEKLVLSATELPPGTYVYTYLVRTGTAGEFRVIPPTAQEFYFPEVYGRGEGSLFTVRQTGATANLPVSDTQVDCSQIEYLAVDSAEAQEIVEQFTLNFKEQNPTEYMGMAILQGVDRLGEWALVQGSVSGEAKDVIVAQQTEQGFQIAERYIITAPLMSFDDGETRVVNYFLEKLPEAPPELFNCLDQSWLLAIGY